MQKDMFCASIKILQYKVKRVFKNFLKAIVTVTLKVFCALLKILSNQENYQNPTLDISVHPGLMSVIFIVEI